MKFILCDHWREAPEGWVVLKEQDQDITKRLQWEDNSVEALFSCHGIEHVDMMGAISYFKECMRVLKPGGIVRTVCPMIDQLIRFDQSTELGQNYTKVQLSHYYPNELNALKELGIDFMRHGMEFMLDSLLKKHGHMHVWSSTLMAEVLQSIGFEVNVTVPGSSLWDPETCLERVIRGVDAELAWNLGYQIYDPESVCVEARKP